METAGGTAADRGAQALADLYQALDGEIAARRPRCSSSGRCCRFDAFGHRLYVTALELSVFMAALRKAGVGWPVQDTSGGAGCPFQVDGLCSVHSIRPFGCRIFFCDATAEAWQAETYERFHARIKAMHEGSGMPYSYMEWRAALRAAGVVAAEPGADKSAVAAKGDDRRLSLPQVLL